MVLCGEKKDSDDEEEGDVCSEKHNNKSTGGKSK